MISVVMPYWQRQQVLLQNLSNYRLLYPDEDLEIVIVNDGSPEWPKIGDDYPWPVRLIELPPKTHALNPCFPLNRGVAEARGEVILLTCPEVIHRAPILKGMREKLESLGPKGYVSAACFGGTWWYSHSTLMPPPEVVGRMPMPEGAALHFCSMLYRGFFDQVGGFDEQYRAGAGYEDSDFLWSLHKHGAKFAICDDLITDHLSCPRCEWPAGGAERNLAIFESKWKPRSVHADN